MITNHRIYSAGVVLSLFVLPLSTIASSTSLVSVNSSGVVWNASSVGKMMSADGRYILLDSDASNLVAWDTNGKTDVFMRDTVTNTTILISARDWTTLPWNNFSAITTYDDNQNLMSSDGRYVIFGSDASDLVAWDSIWTRDVFVRDTQTNSTKRVSINTSGVWWNGQSYLFEITPNGRYVVFYSESTNLVAWDTNGQVDVFVRDLQNETTTRVSVSSSETQGNSQSVPAWVSADWRYILFNSYASDLVAWDSNGAEDVFVRDTVSGNTIRVSTTPGGTYGDWPSTSTDITPDGRYVLFWSYSTNIVAWDANWRWDVFVKDLQTNITKKISIWYLWATNSIVASKNISIPLVADAPIIIGPAEEEPIPIDWGGGPIDCVSCNIPIDPPPVVIGVATTTAIAISTNGRYVLFSSDASDIVAWDTNWATDLFLRDTVTNSTTRINVWPSWAEANDLAYPKYMTPDGRYVVYSSPASNLVAWDTNSINDVFMRDTLSNITTRVNVNNSWNAMANGLYQPWWISSDWRYVLLWSDSANLAPWDTNWVSDAFLRDTLNWILYTDPNWVYSFYYPAWLQYKNPSTAWTIWVVFTRSWSVYNALAPIITIAKWPSNKSLSQVVSWVTQAYRRLFRNNFTLTTEIERTAHGVPSKQLHITGKIAWVDKTFIITFIRLLSQVYVISANGTLVNANTLDSIVDTMISTRKFSPIPAGIDGNATCLFCE